MSIGSISNKMPFPSIDSLSIEDEIKLGDSLATTMAVGEEDGGIEGALPDLSDFLGMPLLPLYDIPNLDDSMMTTMAVGEEDGGLEGSLPDLTDFLGMPVFQPLEIPSFLPPDIPNFEDLTLTTQAVGEEDDINLDNSFTDFFSVLGNSVFPDTSDEMGLNDDIMITMAIGEDDLGTQSGLPSIAVGEFNPSMPSQKTDITSLSMGEEDVFGEG